MSHILTKTDRESKAGLLAALIGHFVPEVWPKAAARALRDVGRVGRAETIANMRAAVSEAQEAGRAKDADEPLRSVFAGLEGIVSASGGLWCAEAEQFLLSREEIRFPLASRA